MHKAHDFVLQDQHGKLFTLSHLEGVIVIMIAGNSESLEQNRQWGKVIKEQSRNGVYIVGIADTRKISSVMESMARTYFKNEEISILLDWKGTVFDLYSLTSGVSNIILIDRKGFIRYVCTGEPSRKAVMALFQEVEALENN